MSLVISPSQMDSATLRQMLQTELERCLGLLISRLSPQKIILFGSLAQEQTQLWSDIDLVVVADTTDRFLDRTKELLRLLQPTVGLDVLVYTPEEFDQLCLERTFFQEEILAKGKILYERGD